MDEIISEDRIRALIGKAIAITDPGELEEVMTELRVALRAHIRQARRIAASSWPLSAPKKTG